MRYAIYSLSQNELLRIIPTLDYDSGTEGYTEVADAFSGNPIWSDTLLNFTDPNDPLYIISSLEFIKKFTQMERVGIHQGSVSNAVLRDLLYMLIIAPMVDLRSHDVENALLYLESLGTLSPDRLPEIRGF